MKIKLEIEVEVDILKDYVTPEIIVQELDYEIKDDPAFKILSSEIIDYNTTN